MVCQQCEEEFRVLKDQLLKHINVQQEAIIVHTETILMLIAKKPHLANEAPQRIQQVVDEITESTAGWTPPQLISEKEHPDSAAELPTEGSKTEETPIPPGGEMEDPNSEKKPSMEGAGIMQVADERKGSPRPQINGSTKMADPDPRNLNKLSRGTPQQGTSGNVRKFGRMGRPPKYALGSKKPKPGQQCAFCGYFTRNRHMLRHLKGNHRGLGDNENFFFSMFGYFTTDSPEPTCPSKYKPPADFLKKVERLDSEWLGL